MTRSRRFTALVAAGLCVLLPASVMAADKKTAEARTPPARSAPEPASPSASLLSGWQRPVLNVLRSPAVLLMEPSEAVEYQDLDQIERGKFLDRFWSHVAPNCPRDPNTGMTPVEVDFEKRVVEANAKFADEGVPGWVTDRGQVFVLAGAPDKIEPDASGATQTWTWANPARTVRFVRSRLNWRFAGVNPTSAQVKPEPIEAARIALVTGVRGRGCELTAEQKAKASLDTWRKSFYDLAGEVLAGKASAAARTVEPQLYFFPAESDATFVMLTVTFEKNPGGRLVALLRPDAGDQAYAMGTDDIPFELRPAASGFIAQTVRAVPPGRYALAVGSADESGNVTTLFAGEKTVVRMGQDALGLSSVILADNLNKVDVTGQKPFHVFGFELVPNPARVLAPGSSPTIFFAVLGATKDGQQKIDVKVRFNLMFNSVKQGKWINPFPGKDLLVKEHQTDAVLAQAFSIPGGWPRGDYKLMIEVTDNRTGGTTSLEVPFKLKPAA